MEIQEVIIAVQIRLKSGRLPLKALLPFPIDKDFGNFSTVIEIFQQKFNNLDARVEFLVPENDLNIFKIIFANNIKFFGGSEHNVIKRYCEFMRENMNTWIIRICGDSPYIERNLIKQVINDCKSDKFEQSKMYTTRILNNQKGNNLDLFHSSGFYSEMIKLSKISDQNDKALLHIINSGKALPLNIDSNISQLNSNFDPKAIDTMEDYLSLFNN